MTKTDVQMLKNYIGGQWIEAETSQTEAVYNPATGEIIAEVPLSTKKMSNMRYRQLQEAFSIWSKTPVPRRARILFKYQQLLVEKMRMSWLNS
ncbi:aldehyde dehydrogenase family protein [Bacillus sp. SL00103]